MKKLIFIFSLSALILVGCEEKCKRTFWVNTEIECCSVKNPIDNLNWLKQTAYFSEYETATYSFSNYILLFKNNTTHDNFIVTNTNNNTNWIIIYDCDGNEIGGGAYNYTNSNKINYIRNGSTSENNGPANPCRICDEFFETHTLTDTIAYFIVEP